MSRIGDNRDLITMPEECRSELRTFFNLATDKPPGSSWIYRSAGNIDLPNRRLGSLTHVLHAPSGGRRIVWTLLPLLGQRWRPELSPFGPEI